MGWAGEDRGGEHTASTVRVSSPDIDVDPTVREGSARHPRPRVARTRVAVRSAPAARERRHRHRLRSAGSRTWRGGGPRDHAPREPLDAVRLQARVSIARRHLSPTVGGSARAHRGGGWRKWSKGSTRCIEPAKCIATLRLAQRAAERRLPRRGARDRRIRRARRGVARSGGPRSLRRVGDGHRLGGWLRQRRPPIRRARRDRAARSGRVSADETAQLARARRGSDDSGRGFAV